MARGKHSAIAARRQAEAALELAERLGDKNADLRARARRVEADAARVPALEARIRIVIEERDAAVSPILAREREEARSRIAEMEEVCRKLRAAVKDMMSSVDPLLPGVAWIPTWIVEEQHALDLEFPVGVNNREHRRARQFGRTSLLRNERALQDNLRSAAHNNNPEACVCADCMRMDKRVRGDVAS